MFTKQFVKDTLERALSTAAQAALLALGGQQLSIVDNGWLVAVGFAAGGFVLAVVKALAAYGKTQTASLNREG